MMRRAVERGTGTAAQIPGSRSAARPERPRPASRAATRRGSSRSPAGDETAAGRDRGRRSRTRAAPAARPPRPIAREVMQALLQRDGESLTSRHADGHDDQDTLIRHALRRALPHRRASSARAGWRRLPRRGPGARTPGRDQDPRRRATRATSSSSSASAARRQNAAGLSHPNIVSIYDRGEAEGTYYIAMEYVEGRTLKELIVARGPCPMPVAIDYTRQILAALRFAHRNGIVHRDIKPHNVIVDAEGRVKVTDFGIARAGASQMTEAGSIIGTAQYLSPEQARGAPVDQTLRPLLDRASCSTSCSPARCRSRATRPVEIAMKHLSETPPAAVRRSGPDVPRDLDLVVLRALAKEPADRYQSAEEMDADLERVARGGRVAARPPRPRPWCSPASAPSTRPRRRRSCRRRAELRPHATSYDPTARRADLAVAPRDRLAARAGRRRLAPVYEPIQDQLQASETVAVPYVDGIQRGACGPADRGGGAQPNVTPRVRTRTSRRASSSTRARPRATRVDEGDVVAHRRLLREAGGRRPERRRPVVATTPSPS